MNNYGLANVLIFLGACLDSVRWAAKYGTDWELALKECISPYYLLWLATTLNAKGFLSRHALIKPFAVWAHADAVRREHAESIKLAQDYIDWCDSAGTPEQEHELSRRTETTTIVKLRLIAATRTEGQFVVYSRLVVANLALDDIRQSLGPHLISGLRAYAESLKDPP